MNDFSEYKFEDFIADTSFINYAKGTVSDDIIIWEDWLAENPHKAKTAEEAKSFINHLFPKGKLLPQRFINDEWDRLYNKLDFTNRNVQFSNKFWTKIKFWHYAAAIALILTLLGLKFSGSILNGSEPITYNEIIVPKGEIKNILLPDGTLVYLNSVTKLSYHSPFGKKSREVTLEGEAYFDVNHNSGKPFIVFTRENEIKVLGTAFNVKAYPDENIHQTSLERGKIMISDLSKNSRTLNPNQTYLLIRDINSSKVYRTEKIEDYSSWKDGRLVLRNQPFGEIARDLERTHGVEIRIQKKEILNTRYTGEFSRKDNIRKILRIISLTSHFDFVISEDTIVIN